MYLHNLTDQIPKTIYLNHEQTPKPKPSGKLAQERIDFAFGCKTRLSNTIADYQDSSIRILNSKHTNDLGVIEAEVLDGVNVRLTNIERTLIDITVRPEYSGGPNEVLTAFRNAAEHVSINKLVSILKKVDHVYPYHQAIGFYLEKSGAYRKSQIDLLKKQEMQFDFYLMHQIKNAKYSSNWKLFYPESLD
jgi:predicted transcriptional regulator of viral defense system